MTITLYHAPITCSLVPFVTLTEAGAAFDVRPINTSKGEHLLAEYLAVNPLHKVPVLEVDGVRITENVAIQTWIARAFPNAQLLPQGPDEITALSLMGWFSSGIHPFLTRIAAPARVCAIEGTADVVRRQAADMIHENLAVADRKLEGRDYFFDHFTAPDVHFFWCVRRVTQFNLSLDAHKNVRRHFEHIGARDSVRRALAYEAKMIAA